MANITEIARKVGVSKTTVSLYLNDPETKRVSAQKKIQIDKVIKKLNYRPNVIARGLSQKKTNTIVLLIPYDSPLFGNAFLNMLLSGVQSVLFGKRYGLLFLPTRGDDSSAIVKNQLRMGYGFDGFIIFGTRYCTLADMKCNVEEMISADIPFVTINYPEMDYPINQVIFRNPLHANAVNHLITMGHSKILLIAGRENAPDTADAIRGYKNLMNDNKIPINPDLIVYGDYERTFAKAEVLQKIKAGVSFTAVYCLSDDMAMGVYEALQEYNLKIPGDISVVGRHDYPYAELLNPPLTTVRRQLTPAGKCAAEILLRTIETGKVGRKVVLDSELVLRSSTTVLKK